MQAEVKRKYMGVVTDMQWKFAVMEKFPNRNPRHHHALDRQRMVSALRDIPELAAKSCSIEARRYYKGAIYEKQDKAFGRAAGSQKEETAQESKI